MDTIQTNQQLINLWNDTVVDYPDKDKLLHQLFERQAERIPTATAIVFENQHLTYQELNQRANQLAHYLQSLGVGPETLVGVYAERSFEMVIGLYGILKAGGAYVPLDPTYPPDRIAYMMENAQMPVLLTQSHLQETTPLMESKANVICLDLCSADFNPQSTNSFIDSAYSIENPTCEATPNNLAYVIYTSGSTGKPKGVMNEHRGIVNRLLWMQQAYPLDQTDAILQKTPFSFDVSVWEFFWPLMFGARLVIARPEGHKDAAYLINLIVEQQITTLHFVPSMLHLFLDESNVEACNASFRRVVCSGEALSYALQQRHFSRLNAPLYNLYGPTEAAVDVTHYTCRPDSDLNFVPIGKPIANIQLHILDEQLQPCPIDEAGELHIGGIGVARGYLNRPELTAERFIDLPDWLETNQPIFHAKLYKTGDLARYLPDGNIEYLGRLDFQVKIRGFRIELGEIETRLREHPAIHEAVVIDREDTPGNKQLVAYLIITSPEANIAGLREFLQETLPEYMVPATFVILDEMPLSPNGKLDRKALPTPIMSATSEFVAPRSPVEEILASIWQHVLRIEQIGIHDNFLELGGQSILAGQIIARIRNNFQLKLSPNHLFEAPTVAGLSQLIINRETQPGRVDKIARLITQVGRMSDQEVHQLLRDNSL